MDPATANSPVTSDHDSHRPPDPDRLPGPDERGQGLPEDDRRSMPPMAIAGAVLAAVLAAAFLVALSTDTTSGSTGTTDGASVEVATLEFLTGDGSTAALADYRGQALVVNFFASWCPPCRAELPDFEQVHQDRRDEVTFLGVNHDLDETTWRTFVSETEITYETVFQPNTEIFTALEAQGMPSTAFVSPDGEILYLHTGLLTGDRLNELIDQHLGGA